MRVLMTTDTVGGVWTYTRELVEGLTERGVEVTLVSFGASPRPDQSAWAEAIEKREPQRFQFIPAAWKLEWMPDGHASFDDSCAWLLALIDRERPDLFHSNQLGYGALPVDIPKLVAAHSDVVSWWHARHGETPPATGWMARYRQIVNAGLAGADAVVTPTAWLRDQLTVYYAVSRGDCRVIPNGRSVAFSPTPKKMQAVTAGRLWDEGKNIRILENVTAIIPIYIAGEAYAPGEDGTGRRSVPAASTCMGGLDEAALHRLFAESAIYIATSLYEPFGLAPLEAAQAGCALVLNDIPSFREVWGDAALYYRHNDAEDLSATLNRLQQNPAEAKERGDRARERASRLYTPQTMVQHYAELYAALARERTAACVA